LANLKIVRDEHVLERIQPRIAQLTDGLRTRFTPLEHVADLRQCGLMAGIELMQDPARKIAFPASRQTGVRVIKQARCHGVIIRPLGDVIILMPPLSISEAELETLMNVTHDAVVAAVE